MSLQGVFLLDMFFRPPYDHQAILPLSWTRSSEIRPVYRDIPLPFSKLRWITQAEIPHDFSAAILHEDLALTYPDGYLFRGCPPELAGFFSQADCRTLRTGYEAVLSLDGSHLETRRVRNALSRGQRHGKVAEVVMNDQNRVRLASFRNETRHAGKPQLRHVFRDKPDHTCRCFVFSDDSDNWLAAMTISVRGRKEMHTELMLKHRHAPGDIMECLVAGIFRILKSEGAGELSLGEAPFLNLEADRPDCRDELELFMIRLMTQFRHAYDHEGLFRFKNKFAPLWRPVMVCSSEAPSPLMLASLAMAMGYTDLLVHESIDMLRQLIVTDREYRSE